MRRIFILTLRCFTGLILAVSLVLAEENKVDEYQASTVMHHAIAGRLTGSVEAEYHQSPDLNSRAAVLGWPELTYTVGKWMQVAGGLRSVYTDNTNAANVLELRPYAGAKVQVQSRHAWHYYNYTRYEYRYLENRDSHTNTGYGRIRSRFAVEIPFSSALMAWKPKTWYALADVEPYYRLDKGTFDPIVVRGGLGYVLNDRFRTELIYQAQFAHPAGGGAREVTSNILQFNVKVGLQAGLLRRLQNMARER